MTLPTKETVEMLRSGYPNGMRVRLVKMNNLQAPPLGTEGTVVGVDDTGSLLMHWDNGCSALKNWNACCRPASSGRLRCSCCSHQCQRIMDS